MKKLTTEEFINRAKQIHGDKYDYSMVEYTKAKNYIKIICKKHGVFEQTADSHLRGNGCYKCAIENRIKEQFLTTEEFINRAKQIHGDKYDYSQSIYTNYNTKIKIICKKHGLFEQTAREHLDGNGCIECSYKYRKELMHKKALDTFEQFKSTCKYDLSKFEYKDAHTKSIAICKKHGEFSISFNNLSNDKGCPLCKSSKGENKVRQYLQSHNIQFEEQKKFNNCKYKKLLPFDFYIPNINTCIEYDGQQHFGPVDCFGGDEGFNLVQKRDNIKTQFCANNNIKLLRISYQDFDNIDSILDKILN